MVFIKPFRALRPTAENAAAVSSVPYDVVSTDEARQIANGNPLSFLHVTRSEIDLPVGTDPYSEAVYAKARENLDTIREQAPLVLERVSQGRGGGAGVVEIQREVPVVEA